MSCEAFAVSKRGGSSSISNRLSSNRLVTVSEDRHISQIPSDLEITRSRELGFSMTDIEKLLSLVDENQLTCHEMHQQTMAHVGDVQNKIADLKRLETVLKEIASKCSDGTVLECPIIDALHEPLDGESRS